MAGHSVWKNIKHRKAAVDAKRGKIWSKLSRAVIVAARTGGADPKFNSSLRLAILDAKAGNMPRDKRRRAARGVGEVETAIDDAHLAQRGEFGGGNQCGIGRGHKGSFCLGVRRGVISLAPIGLWPSASGGLACALRGRGFLDAYYFCQKT